MVSEFEMRRAAREMEERAKKAEQQLTLNTKRLEELIRLLQKKDVLTQVDVNTLMRGFIA